MRRILIAASTLAITAGAAHAMLPSFAKLDDNSDGKLTKQELSAAFEQSSLIPHWDSNKDRTIEGGEFHAGIFDLWDENDDDQLGEQELKDGVNAWLDPKPAPVAFAGFDANDNGMVNDQEFNMGMAQDAGLFGAWDQDSNGRLNAQEVHAGIFEVWDTDNDNMISQAEFDVQSKNEDWLK